MAAVTLDIHPLSERLWLGGAPADDGWPTLARTLAPGAVLDLREEAADDPGLLARHGLELLHLPLVDREGAPVDVLLRGVGWTWRQWAGRRRVLIHCQHGIGRSALLALCVRVSEGVGPLRALEEAKRIRTVVSPSPSQLEAFREFLQHWRRAQAPELSVPTVEALGAIAWRNLGAAGAEGETP